jgi:hypothetical protein
MLGICCRMLVFFWKVFDVGMQFQLFLCFWRGGEAGREWGWIPGIGSFFSLIFNVIRFQSMTWTWDFWLMWKIVLLLCVCAFGLDSCSWRWDSFCNTQKMHVFMCGSFSCDSVRHPCSVRHTTTMPSKQAYNNPFFDSLYSHFICIWVYIVLVNPSALNTQHLGFWHIRFWIKKMINLWWNQNETTPQFNDPLLMHKIVVKFFSFKSGKN